MTPSLAPLVRAPRKSTRKRPQLPQRSSPQPSLRTVHPSAQGRPRARCADLGCCQLGGTPRQTARLENAVHVCSDMCSITIVATKAGHAQSVMVKRQWSLAGMSRCSSVLSAFGSIASAPTWPKLARLQIPAQDTTPALKGGRSNSAPSVPSPPAPFRLCWQSLIALRGHAHESHIGEGRVLAVVA